MTKYRMLVYRAGQLWQSHDISASDDTTAQGIALQRFDDLAAELRRQKLPVVTIPTLERFILYDGVRVVCEHKSTANAARP
jgi:hypothetical protein